MSPNLRVMTFIQLSAPSDEEGGSVFVLNSFRSFVRLLLCNCYVLFKMV